MKRIILLPAALLLAVFLAFAFKTKGWTADSFIITNADATTTLGLSGNATLNTLIGSVSPRHVIAYANANQYYNLVPAPPGLTTLIGQVAPRLVIQFANGNQLYSLVTAPAGLATIIGQVSPRFALQYANANKNYTFAYPAGMINDTLAPVGSNIRVTMLPGGSARITWDTNEYATGLVNLGVAPGIYTRSGNDTLVSKQHTVVIGGLVDGQKYYYQVQSTDRSGNLASNSELSFTYQPPKPLFLPYVRR
jgi:hypothetical protein